MFRFLSLNENPGTYRFRGLEIKVCGGLIQTHF
jgi:hypothetical protein